MGPERNGITGTREWAVVPRASRSSGLAAAYLELHGRFGRWPLPAASPTSSSRYTRGFSRLLPPRASLLAMRLRFLPQALFGVLIPGVLLAQQPAPWFAGSWDSSLYGWSDAVHPRTVLVRVEVRDAETRTPIPTTSVALVGSFSTEILGVLDDVSVPRTQRREFRLEAFTGADGVAVFGLTWHKEFPWSQERPLVKNLNASGSPLQPAQTWLRPVDDIEKIRQIEIRHSKYEHGDRPLSFAKLLDSQQDPASELQTNEVVLAFEKAWREAIGSDLVLFVARLGPTFESFGTKSCSNNELFERVRTKQFDITYDAPPNLSGLSKKEFCGPFFLQCIAVELRRLPPTLPARDGKDDDAKSRKSPVLGILTASGSSPSAGKGAFNEEDPRAVSEPVKLVP